MQASRYSFGPRGSRFVWICLLAVVALPVVAQDAGTTTEGTESGAELREPLAPVLVESVNAEYPAQALAQRREGQVELTVIVRTDGSVGEVTISRSGGEDFDTAAVNAVRRWRFEPAFVDGRAVDSRISVPFLFTLPPQADSASASSDAEGRHPEAPIEVTVHGDNRPRREERSASDFVVNRDVINAAPRLDGADILRAAPGVYIGRGEGPAVAHNYMLRGFDAEHGQDIEFRVAGLPINVPSHIHGQGYSDLGFLISDTVLELRISEGVYDPRQGDFAVAGSIELSLGVDRDERGVTLRSTRGSWDTWRHLVLWAPEDAHDETLGAVTVMTTDGFGENRAGSAASGVLQHRFGDRTLSVRMVALLHLTRADLAGVLRADDVDAGTVCFTCVYPYPTALAQNASAGRFMTGLFADYAGEDGANGQAGVWLGYDNFRLQQNFTGFVQQSRVLERVGGRGDLVEQQNRTFSLGFTGRYRPSTYRPTAWAAGTVEVGADGRIDVIQQKQNLLDASVRSQTWDNRVDAGIRALDLGVWGDLDWELSDYVSVRAGVRADMLSYDVEDHLGNFAPLTRPQDQFIPGFRRSAQGLAWGPRTSLEIQPSQWLSILAAYGEGFRSPQARLLEDGETAPFTRVQSADLGMRFDWGDPLKLTVGGYYTHLSDDIAFEAAEGRLERTGATERLGAVAHATTRPTSWFVGSLSFTFVDATLLEPPPPTADEPQPPFTQGQNLPFVPPVVIRADLGVRRPILSSLGGARLVWEAGVGFSYLSARPLPYAEFAEPLALLDGSTGIAWGSLELAIEVFNVLNSTYAAVEYSFPSDWESDDGIRPRTPARHTSAGAPRSLMTSLGVTL